MSISIPFQTEPLPEIVLFAFDNLAFPFQHHIQKHLLTPARQQLVLEPGSKAAHDTVMMYYGTVLHIEDSFHLWYFGSPAQGRDTIGRGDGTQGTTKNFAKLQKHILILRYVMRLQNDNPRFCSH